MISSLVDQTKTANSNPDRRVANLLGVYWHKARVAPRLLQHCFSLGKNRWHFWMVWMLRCPDFFLLGGNHLIALGKKHLAVETIFLLIFGEGMHFGFQTQKNLKVNQFGLHYFVGEIQ